MRRLLTISAVLGLLFVCAPTPPAHAQISFDFSIGTPPPPPRAYRVPAQPGPDYEWVEGYWYPNGKRWAWHNGYWTRPPSAGAYWVAPYWQAGHYHEGYWDTSRGPVRHDHRWDRDKRRDEGRDRDHDDHR